NGLSVRRRLKVAELPDGLEGESLQASVPSITAKAIAAVDLMAVSIGPAPSKTASNTRFQAELLLCQEFRQRFLGTRESKLVPWNVIRCKKPHFQTLVVARQRAS